MAFVDRFFGKSTQPPAIDLAELLAWLEAAIARQPAGPADLTLVRARLADGCRDAGIAPLLTRDFASATVNFDVGASERFALLAGALAVATVKAALPELVRDCPLAEVVDGAFTGLARETPLLTLDLLRQSELRREELVRKFIAALGARVQGESAKISAQQLKRLDYERLLAEAERARAAAQGRLDELKKLQDEQEARRPGRSKW
jgi:hypothetical protein